MTKMNDLGRIIGLTTTEGVVLLNQQDTPVPYELQDLYVLEDDSGEIYPIEISKTFAFGEFEPETINGIIEGESTLHIDGINKNEPVYVAEAISLRDLTTPIPPNAKVRKATFEEVEEFIVYADVNKSFHVGTVKGTENMQRELPKELKDIAPMWDSDKETVVPQNGVPFMYDYSSLREYPHIGLFGSSGSGKSFGMHTVLEEFMKRRIPGIYLDPHNEGIFKNKMNGLPKKHEVEFLGKYKVFTVGINAGIPFSKLSVNDLYYLLEFAGGISDAQKAALDSIYERGDTFSYLMDKLEHIKEAFDYYDTPKWNREIEEDEFRRTKPDSAALYEKTNNRIANVSVIEALTWRLLSLENMHVFDEKNGIDGIITTIRSGRFAVIQGSIGKLQMLSSYLIRTLYDKRRRFVDSKDARKKQEKFPPFIIAGDEFQNFAPNSQYANPTGRIIREIAKEARKYGVYLVVSTQQTSAIDPGVFAQLNTKFIYRLNSMEDIELTSREANLTEEQTKQLPKLLRGHSFVVNPKIPRTMLVKFRTTLTEPSNIDDPFEELAGFFTSENSDLIDVLELYSKSTKTIRMTDIPLRVLPIVKDELERSVTFEQITDALDELVELGVLTKEKSPMGMEYRNKL